MEIDRRIPDLSDKELENLHANAVRLAQSGTPEQKRQAEKLLPLIGATLEERRVARAAAQAEKRRSKGQRSAIVSRNLKGDADE
ncbi:MAG: hypothetical protein ABUL73_01595 [Alphaproteobacteria bacterium]